MAIPGIKLVTFDVTNTLLKFRIPTYDYYALVARDYGFKGTGDDIKKQMFKSYKILSNQHPNFGRESIAWKEWWSRVVAMTFEGHQLVNDKIDKIAMKLIDDFRTPTCWKIVSGTENLIDLLKKSGIMIGVISNFDPRLHEILTNLKIRDYFEFVITSYEAGVSKPNTHIFEKAQAKCDSYIMSSQCLHIGDDLEKDYRGAKAAGWHALLVNDRLEDVPSSDLKNVYSNLNILYEEIKGNRVKLL